MLAPASPGCTRASGGVLVFDPATSQVLVEQDVLTKRAPYIDADPGFVMGYRIVLEQGVIKRDAARP